MREVFYLLLAALSGLFLSGATDSRWGSGVRGALSGVSGRGSDKGVRGVRDRLSGLVSGGLSGWREKAAQLGRTPRPDSRLSGLRGRLSGAVRGGVSGAQDGGTAGVRGRLSGLGSGVRRGWREGPPCAHCGRSDRQCPWCQHGDRGTTWLVREPNQPERYVASDMDDDRTMPRVPPGTEMFWIDRSTQQAAPFSEFWNCQPWQVHDVPDEFSPAATCEHCGGTRLHPGQPGGRPVAPNTPCPWCTKDQTVRVEHPDGSVDYVSWWANAPLGSPQMYERIGDRVFIEDRETGERTEYTRPRPNGAGETDKGDQMTTAEQKRQERIDDEIALTPGRTFSASELRRIGDGPLSGGAIETLPDYQRYLASAGQTATNEMEDAQAGVQRHQALAVSIAEGVARLAALEVDRQTLGEGNRVAEAAAVAKEKSKDLAAALQELLEALKVAQAGAQRHQTAQEVHDAGLLAKKPAYGGN